MTTAEYAQQRHALSLRFLREKRDGIVPVNAGWADWCWANGIYPLDKGTERRA